MNRLLPGGTSAAPLGVSVKENVSPSPCRLPRRRGERQLARSHERQGTAPPSSQELGDYLSLYVSQAEVSTHMAIG